MLTAHDIYRDERGVVLSTALIFLTVLTLLGSTAIVITTTDLKIGRNYKTGSQAFYIGEAGLAVAERQAINDLNTDADLGNTTFNATSGAITILPDSTAFYIPSGFSSVSFGTGSYTIQFKNFGAAPDFDSATLLVRSVGTGPNSSTVTLESYLSAENISPWNNAIFAGGGGGAAPVTGNVIIAGSIHLLGDGLAPTDTAFSNQTGDVRNTNVAMHADLSNAIDGGTSSDLNAKFRVKNGRINMSVGSASIGSSGSPFKGIYVTSGTDAGGDGVNDDIVGGDNAGAGRNIYASQGAASAEKYDLGDFNIPMPSIDTAWLDANSLDLTGVTQSDGGEGLINGDLELTENRHSGHNRYYPDINQTDGTNSIDWDSTTQTLTITGIVKVSSLVISEDVSYAGSGTLYVTGNTVIDADVLPSAAASYPTTNVLGVITGGDMTTGGSSQLVLTGAYYTAGTFSTNKQTELAGTSVCQQFNITNQTPKIWQVPSLANNLPPGMPGSNPVWVFTEKTWREILQE